MCACAAAHWASVRRQDGYFRWTSVASRIVAKEVPEVYLTAANLRASARAIQIKRASAAPKLPLMVGRRALKGEEEKRFERMR